MTTETSPTPPRVGLFGFGRAGRAVATVLLNSQQTRLEWVVCRSNEGDHRSVPGFFGIESDEPGTIISVDSEEYWSLFRKRPVDILVDFSTSLGLDQYLTAAFRWNLPVITAIPHYHREAMARLHQLAKVVPVLWSRDLTLGVNSVLRPSRTRRRLAPWATIGVPKGNFHDEGDGFGATAILAVKSLIGKPAGLYTMDDLLEPRLRGDDSEGLYSH